MDRDGLVAVLRDGSRAEVLDALSSLSPAERKDLGPVARAWLTEGSKARVRKARQALAVLATAGGARQAQLAWRSTWDLDDAFVEDAVAVVAARELAWLPDLVDLLVAEEAIWSWRFVRAVVRAGLISRPDRPEYLRGTVRAVPVWGYAGRVPLADQIEGDPGLAGSHLFGMLATEGAGRLLAIHDKQAEGYYAGLADFEPFPEITWRSAILTLIERGRLSRDDVLDAVLAAPLRDWAATDLGWYAQMHDALEPTIAEVLDRQLTYTRLLTVGHGPSVKVAQRALVRLVANTDFEPEPVVAASRATLGRSDKASVVAQLQLLGKIATAYPEMPVAETVRVALEHTRAEVREQAAQLLESLGESTPEPAAAVRFVSPAPEQRASADRVEPVTHAAELAELLLDLFEEPDALGTERAVDGVLRLADQRPALSDLLRERLESARHQDDLRGAAGLLAHAWLTPRKRFFNNEPPVVLGRAFFPARTARPDTLIGGLGLRLTAVANAARRGPCASLAFPEYADGSIDADTLSRRIDESRGLTVPSNVEVALALLRVRPQDRATVRLPGTLRRAGVVARVLAAAPPDWERQLLGDVQRVHLEPGTRALLFRDPTAPSGDAIDGFLSRRDPAATVKDELWYADYETRHEATFAVAALHFPHNLDIMAAHLHPYLVRDLSKDRAIAIVPALDAIARATAPNGAPESSALVLGMAAKDVRARTAAQDAILDLARHGLLDGQALGRQAALLLADGLVVGKRVSGGLVEACRASDAVVVPVLAALIALVEVLPGRRDALGFAELAADLAERTGTAFELPIAFRTLAAGRSSSLLAKAVRRLGVVGSREG